jgi:restriction endonuclease
MIFELSRRYGFQKFIIVVPSVAIREGVGSSPDFVDTVVPQTAIVSYWTGDRYPNDE